MVQSDESIKANVASWLWFPNNGVPNNTTLDLMVEYLKGMRTVDENEELVEPYKVVEAIALANRDFDLESEVSFYQDMYEYMNFVVEHLKGGV